LLISEYFYVHLQEMEKQKFAMLT